jgi:hypothetical protein
MLLLKLIARGVMMLNRGDTIILNRDINAAGVGEVAHIVQRGVIAEIVGIREYGGYFFYDCQLPDGQLVHLDNFDVRLYSSAPVEPSLLGKVIHWLTQASRQ